MKKLIVLLIMFLPLGVFSQEVKIAVVNAGEVFNMMPEQMAAQTQLAAFSEQYQKDLQDMDTEYTAKYEEYMKLQDTLTENLKLRRQQEIQDLSSRIQNFYTVAQQDIEQKQAELLAPIQEKLQKTIEEVGKEQGYTIILNPAALLYQGTAIDATPLVKAKLGLR
jgi:outer membrane protein